MCGHCHAACSPSFMFSLESKNSCSKIGSKAVMHIPKKKEPKCPPASGAVHAQSQQIIRMLRCHTLLLLLKNHKVLQAVPATAHCHTVDNGCCEQPLPPSVSAISPAAAADWYLQKNLKQQKGYNGYNGTDRNRQTIRFLYPVVLFCTVVKTLDRLAAL